MEWPSWVVLSCGFSEDAGWESGLLNTGLDLEAPTQAAGRNPQSLFMWTCSLGYLGILTTCWLASSIVSEPRQGKRSCNVFHDLASEVTCLHLCNCLSVTQVRSTQCGKGLFKGVATRKRGSLMPSWGLCPATWLTKGDRNGFSGSGPISVGYFGDHRGS